MTDKYQYADTVETSARNLFAITPSDSVALAVIPKALYVGVTGNVAIQAANDTAPVTLVGVPAGSILPIRAAYVLANGTTATSIVGLA